MLNYAEARDEIRKLFKTRFDNFILNGIPGDDILPLQLTKRGSVIVYVPEIKWDNKETTEPSDNGVHWLRLSTRNVLKRQKSLTGGREEEIGTIYRTQGLVKVDLYFSKSAYEQRDADNLNLIVERCFIQQNTPCGVWFRNPIVVELEQEESHFRSNVLAEYQYDSVIQ
jgi:hypothetical protein